MANRTSQQHHVDSCAEFLQPIDNLHSSNKTQLVVSTLCLRRTAVELMISDIADNGKTRVFTRTVRKFSDLFSGDYKANIAKASSQWQKRSKYIRSKKGWTRLGEMMDFAKNGSIRHNVKAFGYRGRKRALWVSFLYAQFISKVERICDAKVKTSPEVLRCIAIPCIQRADTGYPFSSTIRLNGQELVTKITIRWI